MKTPRPLKEDPRHPYLAVLTFKKFLSWHTDLCVFARRLSRFLLQVTLNKGSNKGPISFCQIKEAGDGPRSNFTFYCF